MLRAVLAAINGATKWAVSSAVFATLAWRRDVRSCWCVAGSIVSAFNCKVLKRAINQSRPEGARKVDPGMPSSHAQSLGFLSAYLALELAAAASSGSGGGGGWGVAAAAALVGGVFLSSLRVVLDFHTPAQVVAGHAMGAASAGAWRWLGEAHALLALQPGSWAAGSLYAGTAVLSSAFAVHALLGIARERRKEG